MNLGTTEESVQAEIISEVQEATDDSGELLFKNYRFTALSRIRTLLEAAGRAIYLFVDRELVGIQKAIHPHTAEEEDLHEWLHRYGLSWKEAVAAVHTVRIGSMDPVYYETVIPQGTVVTTDAPDRAIVKFRTLEEVTLPAGVEADGLSYPLDATDVTDDGLRYTVPVQVECITTGAVGNVTTGTITLFESAPEGVDFVYNPNSEPDITGLSKETSAQVRARLKIAENSRVGAWTKDWYCTTIQDEVDIVERAVFKSSKELGLPGTVKIFVLGREGNVLTQTQLDSIVDLLDSDDYNPGGVARFLIENFTPVPIDRTVTVKFADSLSLASEETLTEIYERYFAAIGENENFSEDDIKAAYLALPRTISVSINPTGDVEIGSGEVAVAGTWLVEAVVHNSEESNA